MNDTLERPLSADVAANSIKVPEEITPADYIDFLSDDGKVVPDQPDAPQNSEDGPGTTEIIEGNAFAPESIGAVQVILLSRIYDVLLLLLKNQNPADAKMIEAMHTAGIPLGPDPSWAGSDE